MNSGKVLLGILAGVAVGGILGVLFAPAKGSRTRKRIANKSEGYVDALKDQFDGFLDAITEKYENVKEEISDLADQGKAKLKEAQKDGKNVTA